MCPAALRSSFARSLLLGLDLYDVSVPDAMFLLFYKKVTRELATKLAVIFKHLVKKIIFPGCWRLADVMTVPKKCSSSDIGDYTTPVLSKVFENISLGS